MLFVKIPKIKEEWEERQEWEGEEYTRRKKKVSLFFLLKWCWYHVVFLPDKTISSDTHDLATQTHWVILGWDSNTRNVEETHALWWKWTIT